MSIQTDMIKAHRARAFVRAAENRERGTWLRNLETIAPRTAGTPAVILELCSPSFRLTGISFRDSDINYRGIRDNRRLQRMLKGSGENPAEPKLLSLDQQNLFVFRFCKYVQNVVQQ